MSMFPMYLNYHSKVNLKKFIETLEEHSSFLSKEANEVLELVCKGVADRDDEKFFPSSITINLGDSRLMSSINESQDVLSIFFSPEIKELGQKKVLTSEPSFEDAESEGFYLDPTPMYMMWEGLPFPEIEEYLHPDAEAEFISTYKFRGPFCTYLARSEIPHDFQSASEWLADYLLTVAKILLAKVKEIESGLSIGALKERAEEEAVPSYPTMIRSQTFGRKGTSSSKILSQYISEKKSIRMSGKIENLRDSFLSGYTKEQVGEEEVSCDLEEEEVEGRQSTATIVLEDSPFSLPTEESPQELEAYAELVRQLDTFQNTPMKLKTRSELTPQYLTHKTSQVIQQNNLIQLENTALEIFLSKLHITVNYHLFDKPGEQHQPTWGQILSDSLCHLNIFKVENPSVSNKDNTPSMDMSSETKQTPSQSMSSSIVDTDTMESVSVSVHEISRYMYTPPSEVVSFEALTSNHFFGVKPPMYRFMSIEEAVKRADEKRDLSKRIYQMKREIVRTFLKDPESDSDSDDGEYSGWKKWFSFERRIDIINNAMDNLLLLNVAQHNESIKTLRELSARKQTTLREIAEKAEYCKELVGLQKIMKIPSEQRLPSQRRFSDVLYKMMKGFLTNDLKTKNLMLAHQRTLAGQIIELNKTVRHLEQLEKKTDWGDLALQRLQYNSAHKRNVTVDEDIKQLKKLNATYTLKLIHAREELDYKVRENRNLMKQRDLSVKKKTAHKEAYMFQHRKLVNVQKSLDDAPKITDVERFVIQAKTEEYKKKKMKQYQTELEVKEANKKVQYLQNRINGLSVEPRTAHRLKVRHKKVVKAKRLFEELETFCVEEEKKEFGVHVKAFGIHRDQDK